jgi:hypothetical protein
MRKGMISLSMGTWFQKFMSFHPISFARPKEMGKEKDATNTNRKH